MRKQMFYKWEINSKTIIYISYDQLFCNKNTAATFEVGLSETKIIYEYNQKQIACSIGVFILIILKLILTLSINQYLIKDNCYIIVHLTLFKFPIFDTKMYWEGKINYSQGICGKAKLTRAKLGATATIK